jgi:hypothetical protein
MSVIQPCLHTDYDTAKKSTINIFVLYMENICAFVKNAKVQNPNQPDCGQWAFVSRTGGGQSCSSMSKGLRNNHKLSVCLPVDSPYHSVGSTVRWTSLHPRMSFVKPLATRPTQDGADAVQLGLRLPK